MKKRLLILLTLVCILSLPIPARAANPKKIIDLYPDETYTKYDFTGDGKNDKFKYAYNKKMTHINCYINGKLKSSIPFEGHFPLVELCSLNKNTVFLLVQEATTSSREPSLYTYSSGKFKKSFSCSSFKKATPYMYVQYIDPGKLTSSSITMSFSTYPNYSNSKTFKKSNQKLSWNVKYNVKNKKLSLSSRTYLTSQKKFTALTTFKTSTTAPTSKYNSFTVKKGDKVTLLKMYCPAKGKQWYKIRKGSKEGWFQDSSSRLLK